MAFELRLLVDSDIPELQRVYEACPEAFHRLVGRPALPDQAAADFLQGIATPGRNQFGVFVGDKMVGSADLKLDDEVEGQAHLGLLLLAPPYDDPDIAGLALRILERWLAEAFGVRRLETGVPAQDPRELRFWQSQGYDFTGRQYRRDLPNYAPRFLVLGKDLS